MGWGRMGQQSSKALELVRIDTSPCVHGSNACDIPAGAALLASTASLHVRPLMPHILLFYAAAGAAASCLVWRRCRPGRRT